MKCGFIEDNTMNHSHKWQGTRRRPHRKESQGGRILCQRLWLTLFCLGIILIMTTTQQCLALVLMETPAPPLSQQQQLPEPQPTTTADNLPAAAINIEDNSTNQTKIQATASRPTNSPSSPPNRLPPPKRVELNKCCLFAEYLDKTKTCVAGATDKWVPLIYLINRKTYYMPQGSSPKFITFQDNVFPISQARNINDQTETDDDDDNVSCTVDDLFLYTGTNNFVIFSNGSLFLPDRVVSIPPHRYCVDQQAALVCFPKPKHPEPTLQLKKCCGPHGIYDNKHKRCHLDGARNNQLNLSLAENVTYKTIYGFPECNEGSKIYAIAGDWTPEQLLSDETGHFHLPHHQKNLSAEDYCLENLRTDKNGVEEIKVFACLHHFGKETNTDPHQTAALNFGIAISVVFLAATLVASYLMPSIHHVLHWRCQIYYVFCLFIGDFLLAFSQFYEPLTEGVALCQMVASVMHFFFLAAFFWLNTMCFNIWWTFRDFRPSSLERNQEVIRLRLYSAYAWGIPLLIAAIAACVNLAPESSLLRPGFGEKVCWFNRENLPIFAYFYGPVGILLSINIMLFISTTHQLTCGLWKRDDVKSTTEKTALGKVCLKLVVVMGVTWIVEVISWLVGGPDDIWFVTDLVNALQGVFIFLVVGCQPQVWAACRRFCCPRSRQEITNTTNGVQHSSSSQGLPSLAACGGEITQNTSVHNTSLGGGGGGGNSLGNHIPTAPPLTTTSTTSTMKIPMETVC
ncbi:adhesion G-protein coupled receptor methuselah-like 1 [Musca autumnalis]|uniref:adhesion G-protein coupled receptor methuselah-like 1 n=1 Tax=Musca autumnalis TaxID=221902 RepID=UPI003CF8886B